MSNVRPPSQSNAMRAPITFEAHRAVAVAASSFGRSAATFTVAFPRLCGCSPKIPSTVVQASSKMQGLRGLRKFRFLVERNRKGAGRPFAGRRPANNRTSSRQSWAGVEAERECQAMRVGVVPGYGKSMKVRVCVLRYEGEIQSAVRARSVRSTRWPNPSIEGTSNIRLRRLSAAPHVKR